VFSVIYRWSKSDAKGGGRKKRNPRENAYPLRPQTDKPPQLGAELQAEALADVRTLQGERRNHANYLSIWYQRG